jgi:4-amino-4-deoxy-L-arabinose transferase-like glycosyltransferase
MFRSWMADVAVLVAVWAIVCLPNLGAPTLWDIDEGNNAECAREMLVSGNWVVPVFNYRLRTDKPVLLYWLQMLAYLAFGVSELSARLPSALALLGATLAVYWMGQRMFGARSAFLGGALLLIAPGAAGAAHFANPDALLLACTTAGLALLWREISCPGQGSFLLVGVCLGLGTLAKGPVGVVLPAAVALAYSAWARKWRWLLTPRLGLLVLGAVVTALPWYLLVAAETKGVWVKEFLLKHNLERGRSVMEGHGGPFFYYLLVLIPGLMPWSLFIGPALWDAWTRRSVEKEGDSVRFLFCWAGAYLAFFSAAGTKLPNYVLPAYPALALLLGAWVQRWSEGEVTLPRWVEWTGMALLGIAGGGAFAGMIVAARLRGLDGLAAWSWIGWILAAAAGAACWRLASQDRRGASWIVTGSSLAFVALLAGGALPALNEDKPARRLASALPRGHREMEVRIAASRWWQPSLVFYTEREVEQLEGPATVASFLDQPIPAFVAIPESDLEELRRHSAKVKVLTRSGDLYRGRKVVLVTNQ